MPEQLESRRLLAVYDAFAVSALGSTATSSRILEDGVSYSVNISGFVLVQNSENRASDAEYFETWDAVNKRKTGLWADVSSISGLDAGVRLSQVNGAGKWGPQNPAGVYSQTVVGTGRPLQARFIDSPYTDNSGSFSVTISQNIPVSVAAIDATAKEENQDPGTFRISRGGSTRYALPVTFSLTGTSSDGAADYTISHTGSVTIPAGQGFIDVTLTPVDDKNVEFGEAVTLTLQAASQYDLVPGATAAVVKIEDNDLVVDLDTDSNNDGVIDPDNSPAGTDDPIEDLASIPGRTLYVNNDDDNRNGTQDRDDAAVVNAEDDLAEIRIAEFDGSSTVPGTLTVTYDDSVVKLYTGPDRSGPTASGAPVKFGAKLYAEGIRPGSVVVSAKYVDSERTLVDTIRLTVLPTILDVDVNSDNIGGLDRSMAEDAIEADATRPGVMISVGGDRAKMVVEVQKGRSATLSITRGADKMRLYADAAGGNPLNLAAANDGDPLAIDLNNMAGGEETTNSSVWTFWIAAVAPSVNMADIAFSVVVPGGESQSPESDEAMATAIAVDLDVDSDNSGFVEGTAQEDAIEDIAGVDATPGKVLLVNDQDFDNDGIQDYFDGFDAFRSLDEDELLGGTNFAVLTLSIVGLPTDVPLTLDYSASDPAIFVDGLDGLATAPGHLRLWTADAETPRSSAGLQAGGHFVPPGTYLPRQLGAVNGELVTFYVEAIRPSAQTGDLTVTVTVPSLHLSDRVRFTATQLTFFGKAIDEPLREAHFLVPSTLPSPAATGQVGTMDGQYREYLITIHDPRQTTTSVKIAGTRLPLTRNGLLLESPFFVLIAPGAPAHPSLTSIEAAGSSVTWSFNPDGPKRLNLAITLTEWDTELATVIRNVIKKMDGSWMPDNDADKGAFGKAVHEKVGAQLKNKAGWGVDIFVDNGTNRIRSIGGPPVGGVNDTTQIDLIRFKSGYTPEIGQVLEHTQIEDLYDIKTTASGVPNPEQATRLRSVLNGWGDGDRAIKVGLVERRWVATKGWIDNPRGKNAIGLMRMLGLAAGIADTASAAHAVWSFRDDDPEFEDLLVDARKVRAGQYSQGIPDYEQRALFVKLRLNPFLQRRFGENMQMTFANHVAFITFLRDDLD
jgi:hypothetical protein